MPRRRHVTGARIWTGDSARPWASSVTIVDGRIVAVDGDAPTGAHTIDFEGKTITPGLIDAHVHFLLGGLGLTRLDLSGVRSKEAFVEAIRARDELLPPDAWLVAWGWTETNWGGEPPTRAWLPTGPRPIVCHRMDLHASLVNETVIDRCDLDNAPLGVARDDDGTPTGLMVEAAAWEMINPLIPTPGLDERRDALRRAQAHAHQFGLTTVGSMEYMREVEAVFAPLRDELTLRTRITLLDRTWPLSVEKGVAFDNDDRLAVIGYKAFIDGTFGSRTARMKRPYTDTPQDRGQWVELAAGGVLDAWAAKVTASGLSPAMHAIGDEAVALALDVVERTAAADGPHPPIRIEHAQHVDPVDLPRFAGRVASMQPTHRAEDGRVALARLGPERVRGAYAFRALQDAGARLAFGSDWPVVSLDPRLGIRAAVTGRTLDGELFCPEQNLTVEESLVAYTRGAAFALGLDDAGRIEPGYVGDLTVFDEDPFDVDWEERLPEVSATIVGGEVVFSNAAAPAPT